MKRISLPWHGPYSVADLSEKLKQKVSISDEQYPPLKGWGFYMYLDQNQSQAIYIGQAFGEGRSLRNRIRWEVLNDSSRFSKGLKKFGIDKSCLILKVAHIKEATDNGNQIVRDPKLMNDIEMALIHEMKSLTNKSGKKRYRRESIEVLNGGNFTPLPERIKKVTGEG